MDKDKQKTMVTVWCKSRESLADITLSLTAAAETIQSEASRKHQKERERRAAARENSRFFSEKSSSDAKTAYNFEMDRKEIMSRDFEKKVLKDDKHKRYQPTGKDKVDPLIGGHCLNCLKMYDSLKVNDEICYYHKGFISYNTEGKYYFWSCCHYNVTYLKPTHEEHSTQGCTNGRHVWRPHLKASRGDKSEHKHWNKVLSGYKH
ncbi:cysteine and histidine-rich domain-containing protein 1-like [Haliotis rubra]|uniref:cysteine and histidine-rich domain-containing protein 1-like n=1 Tax=Haliotis rubra TaxID=36100 RepID=UPI001EE558D7|nr:cysteine and histidine-rich domain-containing protein 1-like [Haliotis rubra]